MADLIVYTNSEGGMTILIPSSNVYVPDVEGTPAPQDFQTFNVGQAPEGYRAATVSEIASRDVPAATNWYIVDSANVPQDRYFRNAWEQTAGTMSVNMTKAANIHKDYLREQRAPLLAALDIDYMRAVETANVITQGTIIARKQELRDITSHAEISAAGNLTALKAAALSVLDE